MGWDYIKGDLSGGFHDYQSMQPALLAIDTHLECINEFINEMKQELSA